MDRAAIARKLREALFDHIESERREALQDGAIDSLFEKVLASWVLPTVSDEKVRTTANLVVGDGFDLYSAAEPTFTHTTTAASAWGHSHTITMADMPTSVHAHNVHTCQCKPDTTSCGACWDGSQPSYTPTLQQLADLKDQQRLWTFSAEL